MKSRIAIAALIMTLSVNAARASTYSSAVLADNPVAYWRLNEPNSSNTAADSTSNGHTATRNNSGHSGSDLTLGGASLTTDPTGGSGDFAGFERLQTSGFNKISTGYSVEYWINLQGSPTNCCYEAVGDGATAGDFFLMNYIIGPGQGTTDTVRTHFGLENNPPVATDSNTALQLNHTYHVVSTWDQASGLGSIYINGVLDKQVGGVVNPPTAAHNGLPIWLGRDNREDRASNFLMGDVAIYDHALSAAQIANHYQIGVTPVPEPATLLLAGLALVGLTACGQRRRASR